MKCILISHEVKEGTQSIVNEDGTESSQTVRYVESTIYPESAV